MTGETDIDPDSLGESAKALAGIAEQFADALTTLQAEIEGLGDPFGSDEIGMIIGISHQVFAEWAFECYGEAAEEIAMAGDDLDAMATAYKEIESSVDDMLQKIQGRVK